MAAVRTVYFDTNFFVWLARCGDDEAAAVVLGLNGLRVRPVFSLAHVRELFATPRREANLRLHARLARLVHAPLCLDAANWNLLLADGETLAPPFDALRPANATWAVADAHALSAGRLEPAQQAEWNAAHPEIVATMTDPGLALEHTVRQFRLFADQEFFCGAIDAQRWPDTPGKARADLLALCANLENALDLTAPEQRSASLWAMAAAQELLGPEQVQSFVLGRALQQSATATDQRVARVAIGSATASEAEKLSHTFRDAEHMRLFVQYAEVIDLLQVDGPQVRQIQRERPAHAMRAAGLHERCFAARDLADLMRRLPDLLHATVAATVTGA
jgi:hypothetical protein